MDIWVFPPSAYCKYSYSEHQCTSICLNISMVNLLKNRQIASHSSCTICIFLDTVSPQLKTNSYSFTFPMFWYSSVSVSILHLCYRETPGDIYNEKLTWSSKTFYPHQGPSWELRFSHPAVSTPQKKENCQPLLPLTYMGIWMWKGRSRPSRSPCGQRWACL